MTIHTTLFARSNDDSVVAATINRGPQRGSRAGGPIAELAEPAEADAAPQRGLAARFVTDGTTPQFCVERSPGY